VGKSISSLSVGLFSDVTQFVEGVGGKAVSAVRNLSSAIAHASSAVLSFTGIGAAIGAVVGLVSRVWAGLNANAELQKTATALEALAGGADNARGILQQVKELTEHSPFRMPELSDAARELAVFGVSAEQIGPDLQVIADLAAGTGKSVGELAEMYGRMSEKGVVGTKEIKGLMKQGIPIVAELAKQFGVSEQQINSMAKAGQISFPQIQSALQSITTGSGKFAGMAEKMGHTIGAVWDRLVDNVTETLGRFAGRVIEVFHITEALEALNNGVGKIGQIFAEGMSGVIDFAAAVWGEIAGEVTALWTGIVSVWNWGTSAIAGRSMSVGEVARSGFEKVVAAAKWLGQEVQLAFRVAEFAIEHWKESLLLGAIWTLYQYEKMNEQGVYLFTVALPLAIDYLARNGVAMLKDFGNYSELIIGNLVENTINTFTSIPDLITGRVDWSHVWKPLTTGFQSALKESFWLPDRVPSKLEQSLKKSLDGFSRLYSDQLGKAIEEKANRANGIAEKAAATLKDFFGLNDLAKAPEIKIKPNLDPSSPSHL
jgi:tape measure domain-containing protein